MVAQQQQPAVRQGIPAHLTPFHVNMHKAFSTLRSTNFNTDAQPCGDKENKEG